MTEQNFRDFLSQNIDVVKEELSTTNLNQGFNLADVSPSEESIKKDDLKILTEFFKSKMETLEEKIPEPINDVDTWEDWMGIQLVGSLFGKGSEVANWLVYYLQLAMTLLPQSETKFRTMLDIIENVQSQNSRFSLKSFQVMLQPVLNEKMNEILLKAIEKVCESIS